jgi:putative phosphoesterase
MYGLKIPKREIINVENFTIGLDHGEVYPRGDTQQLKYIGMEMGVDVLVTGHTHTPFIKELENVVLLNPGSPTVPRLSDPTVMLVDVEKNDLNAQIIKLGDSACKSLNFKGRI